MMPHMSESLSFTELLISKAVEKFAIPRKTKSIHAGGKMMTVHAPNEKIIFLPNGTTVKVSVDDSGVATQVEEDERLHAIVRPHTFVQKIGGMR